MMLQYHTERCQDVNYYNPGTWRWVFGTNVMEGVLVSIADKDYKTLTPSDYNELLDKIGFTLE